MKGIILAGGTGSRLFPSTLVCSKQLLPIYDKPMIYYPLSILMLAGIREILVISTARDLPAFESLLGDGSDLGLSFSYKVQDKPRGLADAFIVGEDFIGKDSVCLILGDNIFYGNKLSDMLQQSASLKEGCQLYAISVHNPEGFGIAYEENGKIVRIEEKPSKPSSDLAVTGLYFYDNKVVEIAKSVKPSKRGEIEITSINNEYIKRGQCALNKLGRGVAWLDTGTHKSMLKASMFIETVQNMTGNYIACVEEIAYRMGYIGADKILKAAEKCANSDYGKFLAEFYDEIR
ncbi:MAG: glucose-1-phosphate thymidylyltransferase RfbA [Corallococcus sp.]|nr:glucose-1-phosphate thymidylyltransferase RfbA [Bacillota bacterium]MCM1533410.1 glucose-1-phosphate thymidylyltransferase RfbA [Corallococcus sp.]